VTAAPEPEPDWAAYREASFGEPYLVWHDGPDFTEFASRFAADPELATRMLAAGLAEGDALAAQTPRELTLTDAQRARFVRMLTEALPGANAGVRLEAGASLFALTGSAEWSAPVVEVLASTVHWGVRIDAAIRLKAFPPTQALVAALADGVRDPEYLVRYHSANTLLRWAGRTEEISEDERLFHLLAADDAAARWATVGEELAAAVAVER
jgi:HEAT repeat protein